MNNVFSGFYCVCVGDGKLAPIFEKRTKQHLEPAKKAAPVLTEAEKQALEIRRAFLTSGVPEELKRQKLSVFVPVNDAYPFVVWPTDSHTQQRPAMLLDAQQLPGHCDPWSLQTCNLPYRKLAVGNVSPPASLACGLLINVLEKAACYKAEVYISVLYWSSKLVNKNANFSHAEHVYVLYMSKIKCI